MNIGIAAENRPEEKRVIFMPDELKEIASSHSVFVEKGAGIGIGIKDGEYKNIGVEISDAKKVYSCKLVVRLKEPREEELKLMRPGLAVMSMLHLPGCPEMRKLLEKYRITGIAMDEIRDQFGRRKIEALYETGYIGMEKGFELWGGDPSKCVVKIMGYGNLAFGAIQCAARKFAKLTVLNKKDFKEMQKDIRSRQIERARETKTKLAEFREAQQGMVSQQERLNGVAESAERALKGGKTEEKEVAKI